MSYLSNHEQKFYHDNGYIAPIDIFTAEEALSLRNEYENLEKIYPKSMNGKNRNNVHYVTKLFDRIVHNPKILDAVESIIGPNILVGGSTLFVKDPEKKGFISWNSPIARALLNHKTGDIVRVETPNGNEKIKILSVAYNEFRE